MRKFSWYTIPKRMTKLETVYQYAVDRFIPYRTDKSGFGSYIHIKKGIFVVDEDGGWKRYKPNLKGGHTHNHVKNAHKRMKKCNICGKPITKYEGFSSRFTGHICMECRIEDCREHAVMVGISTTGSSFDDLRNPYIKWK